LESTLDDPRRLYDERLGEVLERIGSLKLFRLLKVSDLANVSNYIVTTEAITIWRWINSNFS
jgi:hypothetical protein